MNNYRTNSMFDLIDSLKKIKFEDKINEAKLRQDQSEEPGTFYVDWTDEHGVKVVVTWPDGSQLVDYPVKYEDGKLAYDWPERLPQEVKDAVEKFVAEDGIGERVKECSGGFNAACTPQTQKPGEGEETKAEDYSMVDHDPESNKGKDLKKNKDKKKDKDNETGTRTMQKVDDKDLEQKPKSKKDEGKTTKSHRGQLYLCNSCFKTFRSNESVCPLCKKNESVEKIVTEQFFKHVYNVQFELDGKKGSTRVEAFDEADAKSWVSKTKRGAKILDVTKVQENETQEGKIANDKDKESEKIEKLTERVDELIDEIPGIGPEDQKILHWALDNGFIDNEFPDNVKLLHGIKSAKDLITPEDMKHLETAPDISHMDLHAMYLKYVLLPIAQKAHKDYVTKSVDDVGESKTNEAAVDEKFGVVLVGGSVGEPKDRKPKYFETEEEAKAYAKRMNKLLSPGEKSYYKLKYKTVEDEKESKTNEQHTGKVYRIDIDGVLTMESAGHDYANRTPNVENIDKINWLGDVGAQVILWTHRSEADRQVTEEWLSKNNVKYKSVEFGKPSYDRLVDDRCVNLNTLVRESKVNEKGWFYRAVDELKADPKFKSLVDKYGPNSDEVYQYVMNKEGAGTTKSIIDDLVKYATGQVKSEESKVNEQEKESFKSIAKGIEDKTEAERIAREKGGMAVEDDEDPKKFMVIVKESKIREAVGGKITGKVPGGNEVVVDEDKYLNALSKGIGDAGYGYWPTGEERHPGKIIFEFTSSEAPQLELVVYGEIGKE